MRERTQYTGKLMFLISLPLNKIGEREHDTLPGLVDKLRLLVRVVHNDVGGLDKLHNVR